MISYLFTLYRKLKITKHWSYLKVLAFFISLMAYCVSGFMYFELNSNPDLSWSDSLWWTVVTMTTVGYGDYFPTTMWGRILIGFPAMLLGVSILGYILSILAAAIVEAKLKAIKGLNMIKEKGHIVVCRFFSLERMNRLIQEVHKDKSTEFASIVIIDPNLEQLPPEIDSDKVKFIKGDPTREATLNQANITQAAACIIQADHNDPAGTDNTSLKICLTMETMAPEVFSVAECMDQENIAFLKKANCDSIVCISDLTGQMMVQELQDPGVGSVISELTSNTHGSQFYIIDIPQNAATYKDAVDRFAKQEILTLGIRRKEDNILMPPADLKLEKDDKIVLIASRRPA